MGNIKSKELSKLGYTDNVARSIAIELVAKYCKHCTQEEIVTLLENIHVHPEQYKNNEIWGKLAEVLSPTSIEVSTYELRPTPLPYRI